jgi:hypothetical protein
MKDNIEQEVEKMGWKITHYTLGRKISEHLTTENYGSPITWWDRLSAVCEEIVFYKRGYSFVCTAEGVFIDGFDRIPEGILKELLKRRIQPEKASPTDETCSIGYCEKERKWYGWSHRAIFGFKIGDCVDSEEHPCAASGWTQEALEQYPELEKSLPVGFVAQDRADCKKMAIAFADAFG